MLYSIVKYGEQLKMENADKKLTVSAEDYLEAALRMNLDGKRITVTGVADLIGVSKPAATNALGELAAKGFIVKQPYGDISLTPSGEQAAKEVYEKHKLLRDFLIRLGVSEEVAKIDCCKIEHVLSRETVDCIKRFLYND